MNSALAVRLLREVMQWDETTMGPDQSELITTMSRLAEYKYNSYQQYAPGRQFIESLALWLQQFPPDDRQIALDFIHRHLTFISDQEMRHLVDLTFRNIVRPIIREKVARKLGLPIWQTGKIDNSDSFADELKHSLFLGLSDGARMDEFRRSASLNNDQVHSTYELQTDRARDMTKSLEGPFRNVFLVDDFYGSGKSIIRWQLGDTWLEQYEEGAVSKGRLMKFLDLVASESAVRKRTPWRIPLQWFVHSRTTREPVFTENVSLHVCIYVATEQALRHISDAISAHPEPPWRTPPTVHGTLVLSDRFRMVSQSADMPFDALLHRKYDPSLMNQHRSVGGPDIIHGFSNCGLCLVFSHNTPNNTVYLIWETRDPYIALFPRVDRHRESAA